MSPGYIIRFYENGMFPFGKYSSNKYVECLLALKFIEVRQNQQDLYFITIFFHHNAKKLVKIYLKNIDVDDFFAQFSWTGSTS